MLIAVNKTVAWLSTVRFSSWEQLDFARLKTMVLIHTSNKKELIDLYQLNIIKILQIS